jgi:pentose-5-phosphate-3-epimerase
MWAVINKTTQIVIGVILPDTNIEEVKKIAKQFDVVFMTLENSPANIGDKYINNKFKSIKKGEK